MIWNIFVILVVFSFVKEFFEGLMSGEPEEEELTDKEFARMINENNNENTACEVPQKTLDKDTIRQYIKATIAYLDHYNIGPADNYYDDAKTDFSVPGADPAYNEMFNFCCEEGRNPWNNHHAEVSWVGVINIIQKNTVGEFKNCHITNPEKVAAVLAVSRARGFTAFDLFLKPTEEEALALYPDCLRACLLNPTRDANHSDFLLVKYIDMIRDTALVYDALDRQRMAGHIWCVVTRHPEDYLKNLRLAIEEMKEEQVRTFYRRDEKYEKVEDDRTKKILNDNVYDYIHRLEEIKMKITTATPEKIKALEKYVWEKEGFAEREADVYACYFGEKATQVD